MSSFLKGLVLTLIATTSFGVVAAVQHAFLGHAEGDEVGPKLDYLAEHPGEYDTLFLGSSTIFRQLVPAVFDEEMARGGKVTHSYNLGSPGMGGLEADYALSRLLAAVGGDDNGPTIFFEPGFPGGTLFKGLRTTERTISWHDYTRTKLAFQMIGESNLKGRAALDAYVDAGRCFLWNTTNFAQGPRILRSVAPWLLKGDEPGLYIEQSAGYQALEDSTLPNVIKRGQGFADDKGSYLAGVKALMQSHKSQAEPLAADSTALSIARSQVQASQSVGVTLIGLVPPTMSSMAYALQVAGEFDGFYLYNSPKETPEYFYPSAHFDKNRLDRALSEQFSRQLAADYLRTLLESQ